MLSRCLFLLLLPILAFPFETNFSSPRLIGSIHQVLGTHPFVLTNSPLDYYWETRTADTWAPLPQTHITNENRLVRIFRLAQPVQADALRLRTLRASGHPTVKTAQFNADPHHQFSGEPVILVVNSTHDPGLPNHGQEFIPLIRNTPGYTNALVQQVWINDFTPELVRAEPRPLAAFLSGSFKDWCEVDRSTWRGAEQILRQRLLPIWASCGGAQALAILAESGTKQKWDCPHCRDEANALLPIYTHIGHSAKKACGDYSACLFERGPHAIAKSGDDPVFDGLPPIFEAMQSHCGQIAWPPAGWELIAIGGPGSKTRTQTIRTSNYPIYAAQFHIEMDGRPDTARLIMQNFLREAEKLRGRNP